MDKFLLIHNQSYPYQIKKSKRAKRARITVSSAQQITVTIPWWSSFIAGERLLKEQYQWLQKTWSRFQKQKKQQFNQTKPWQEYKLEALQKVHAIIQKYQELYPYEYKKITIKNLTSRWGSCSSKKNLNFNYRIIFLPQPEAEYLVVHELCHLKEMNHSKRFWNLVAKAFPNYQQLRRSLHKYSLYG